MIRLALSSSFIGAILGSIIFLQNWQDVRTGRSTKKRVVWISVGSFVFITVLFFVVTLALGWDDAT